MELRKAITISEGNIQLAGDLVIPNAPLGLVLFAHGSGSSRKSPRNIKVARTLNAAGIGTLLFDLLTPDEADNRENVFDIGLLSSRLILATHRLRDELPAAQKMLPLAYFGASTGAAAAISAACDPAVEISAIVSRGGRPDLAAGDFERLRAPVLLLVGGEDDVVLELNRQAAQRLPVSKIIVIPGATHLFEEPGTLEEVAEHATNWFVQHLRRTTPQQKRRTSYGH